MKAKPPITCKGKCSAVARYLRELPAKLVAPSLSLSPATPGVAPVAIKQSPTDG